MSRHLCSFALWTALPSSDYYEGSVPHRHDRWSLQPSVSEIGGSGDKVLRFRIVSFQEVIHSNLGPVRTGDPFGAETLMETLGYTT